MTKNNNFKILFIRKINNFFKMEDFNNVQLSMDFKNDDIKIFKNSSYNEAFNNAKLVPLNLFKQTSSSPLFSPNQNRKFSKNSKNKWKYFKHLSPAEKYHLMKKRKVRKIISKYNKDNLPKTPHNTGQYLAHMFQENKNKYIENDEINFSNKIKKNSYDSSDQGYKKEQIDIDENKEEREEHRKRILSLEGDELHDYLFKNNEENKNNEIKEENNLIFNNCYDEDF